MENIAVVLPCFNENVSVIYFLKYLEEQCRPLPYIFDVIVVDDSSVDDTLELLGNFTFNSANLRLTILSLSVNIGHQGSIHQGLLYAAGLDIDRFIVMDSDGEDDPKAFEEILCQKGYDIIHVARGKRKENLTFRISYYIYKIIFMLVTGKSMNFGNYCLINRKVIENVRHSSFVHFAAYLSKLRFKKNKIVINRGKRLHGESKMNLSGLVHHAFKSFIEYSESLLMVFLKLFIAVGLLFVICISYVVYQKLFTDNAILGWASVLSVGLLNMAIICIGFFVMGILVSNLLHKNNLKSTVHFNIIKNGIKS
jgi:glycosyltransferase involved in cell wall biosynthesis